MRSILFVIPLILLTGCGQRNGPATDNAHAVVTELSSSDSTVIAIDPSAIKDIKVIDSLNEQEVLLPTDDESRLIDILSGAVYDTQWNDKGIMIKMVPQDYTIFINYNEQQSDIIPFWEDPGRLKYRGKWFIFDKEDRELYQFLQNYAE